MKRGIHRSISLLLAVCLGVTSGQAALSNYTTAFATRTSITLSSDVCSRQALAPFVATMNHARGKVAYHLRQTVGSMKDAAALPITQILAAIGALKLFGDFTGGPKPRSPAFAREGLYHHWLEFVGDTGPDWERFNLLGNLILEESRPRQYQFKLDDIQELALARFAHHGLPADEGKVRWLLEQMVKSDILKMRWDNYVLDVEPEAAAVKFEAVPRILTELRQAINAWSRGSAPAEKQLHDLLARYSEVVERWPLDPVEARWPVLKAVACLPAKAQAHLIEFINGPGANLQDRPLIDSIYMELTKKVRPNWLQRFAPFMAGRTLYIIGSECWNAAGGLGRVLQYKAAAVPRLAGDQVPVVTIEPYYSHWLDSQGHLQKDLQYGKSGPLVTPVHPLAEDPDFEYDVRVRGTLVKAQVFSGTNEYGVKVYLIRDRQINPATQQEESLITRVVYRYRKWDKPATDVAIATDEEFSEFMSRASLELIRRLEEAKQKRLGDAYKAPMISANDGQLGVFSEFKRDLDRSSAVLRQALVTFVTHTYNNRMQFWGKDASSRGALNADFVQAVAAIHRQEKAAKVDSAVRVVSNTNGDHRVATRRVFLALWKKLFKRKDDEHPTLGQMQKLKRLAKQNQTFDPVLLASQGLPGSEPMIINPDQPVWGYSGRLVPEKAGRERAFTDDNIRHLVAQGVQVVILGNIQADTQWMYDALARLAQEVNPKGPGKLIVRSGWGIREQVAFLPSVDVLVVDSNRETEAAGISETDGMAVGCVIVAPSALEGILQKQGMPIDLTQFSSGNTMIPQESTEKGYRQVFDTLLGLYRQDPKKFASYQAMSVRLSRILEAELPAAEGLRQDNRVIQRHMNPLFLFKELMDQVPEVEKYLWPLRARLAVTRFLSESAKAEPLTLSKSDSGADDVRLHIVHLESGESVLVGIDQEDGENAPYGMKKFRNLVYQPEDRYGIARLLGVKALNNRDLEFVVSDAATGEVYGNHTVAEILDGKFQIGVPTYRFQMLKFTPLPSRKGQAQAAPSGEVIPGEPPPAQPREHSAELSRAA